MKHNRKNNALAAHRVHGARDTVATVRDGARLEELPTENTIIFTVRDGARDHGENTVSDGPQRSADGGKGKRKGDKVKKKVHS